MALGLPPLAHGNHQQTQARLQLYQDQNPCSERVQCLRTSGCDSQNNPRAPSLLPLPRFSLEHMSGLMREFNYTILSFVSMFEDAQRTWVSNFFFFGTDTFAHRITMGLRSAVPIISRKYSKSKMCLIDLTYRT